MIVETHVHLCDEKFDGDRTEVLKRANTAGVIKFLNIGAELKEIRAIAALEIENVYKAMGLHPHNAHEFTEEVYSEIKEYFKTQIKAVAVGEIGMDYYKSTTPRGLQEKVFRRFLELACELNLPIAVHSREAHEDVLNILKEYELSKKGVIHCFTGDISTANKFTDLGYMLGIGGVITFPNAQSLRDAIKVIPLEFLVLETDAPYLTPEPHRGTRNEPKYIPLIAKKIADLQQKTVKEIEMATTANTKALFNV